MATPSFIKKISRNNALRSFACWLGSLYIRLVHATGDWQIQNQHIPESFLSDGKTFITCFWHGRLMMMSYAWPYEANFNMLISSHADGQLIAKTINRLGFHTLEGSTKKGGGSALRGMIRALQNGEYIGITPDGPRGPRMRASNGAIALAKISGASIIPLSYSVTKWKMFSSWDRFICPLPFSKGTFIWGEPIDVANDADDLAQEAARLQLEKALMQVTRQADLLCGQSTPEATSP